MGLPEIACSTAPKTAVTDVQACHWAEQQRRQLPRALQQKMLKGLRRQLS